MVIKLFKLTKVKAVLPQIDDFKFLFLDKLSNMKIDL